MSQGDDHAVDRVRPQESAKCAKRKTDDPHLHSIDRAQPPLETPDAAYSFRERSRTLGQSIRLSPQRPQLGSTRLRRRRAPRHHHDSDDSFAVERQAHRKVTLIRHFAGFTPACDLVRPGNDVALDVLELRLCLFQRELLVSARLLKHLSARCDATKGAARRHGFDLRVEQLFGRVEIMRRDSLYELTCTGELHRRNLTRPTRPFKGRPPRSSVIPAYSGIRAMTQRMAVHTLRLAMTASIRASVTVFALAVLLTGCGATTHHYSAEKFTACLHKSHQTAHLTHDQRSGSNAVAIMSPAFAEWVYFFPSIEQAGAERAKIQAGTPSQLRVMSQLFRTQRSNALVFAPRQAGWLSPIKHCLDHATN
jgi:hypothetical protein